MKHYSVIVRTLSLSIALFFANAPISCKSAHKEYKNKKVLETLLTQTEPFSQAFFIPDDAPKQLLIELIKHEKRQIIAALFNFTEQDVADELLAAFKRGVDVQMIADVEGLRGKYERVTMLYDAGVPVYLYAEYRSLMHNKYLVFADTVGGNAVLWSGSANITKAGLTTNEENIQVTTDATLINDYRSAFEQTKHRIKDSKKNKEEIRSYCAYNGNNLVVQLRRKLRRFKGLR